jgi:copper(I)-binding protein
MNALRAALSLLVFGVSLVGCARDAGNDGLAGSCAPQVRGGWVRLVPGGMPMHAGFGRIENSCAMPATIVSASSPSYGSVMVHESRIVDGVSEMRMLQELRIAPDDAAVLKPGGLHLMLMDPTSTLKPGSHVAIDFALKDGRHVLGDFVVKSATAP